MLTSSLCFTMNICCIYFICMNYFLKDKIKFSVLKKIRLGEKSDGGLLLKFFLRVDGQRGPCPQDRRQ